MAGIWMMFGLGFGSYLMVKSFNGGFHPFLDHPSSYNFLACFALTAMFILVGIYIANLVVVTANLVALVTGCAFEDFEQNQNSKNNGIMSILSSCSNLSTSDKFMAQIGFTVHKYIAESNSQITSLASKMIQPNDQSDDSFTIQKICDPFSGPPNYTYAPANCQQDAIQIHDLPTILSTLTCEKNISSDVCKAEGKFFPESAYGKTMAYIKSIESLIATYPDLQSLAGCTPLKHAIADVASHQCKPFRASVKLLWASILTLSIDLMILTMFWIIKAYQEKGKHFSLCSVVPRNDQQNL
ncbi:hypothetical protein M8C21_020107 [Ambrosia artemisiifolia]|uniref:Uncharacterized protein n=1 Tax=Ambrosia artemisiifolia TaxID=4212 RepID=A0AAD5GKN9_AMBAR|nr:hypothetical protein M8C21_020107 [Ambrosia artemisiifolia]